MKSSDILKKAKKLVAQGWTKGDAHRFGFGRCAYCSIGAIQAVGGIAWEGERARRYLGTVVNKPYVSDWNDRPERTHEQVLAAFDKAIVLAKKSHD